MNPSQLIRALYIHIPYCLHKCGYCDFNSFATHPLSPQFQKEARRYVACLVRELQLWLALLARRESSPSDESAVNARSFPTIFIGGGTPSLMPSTSLQELFSGLACFDDLQRREVTVEANPETLAADFCGEPWATLSTLPVTRMSFGIQSLRQPILDRLERTHSVAHSLSALSVFSKQTRFRWSGDFIYAVPGLSQEDWLEDLSQYLSYGPTHVSAYQLTLTPGHPLYSKLPSADESALWFEATRETLRRSGLSPYETSNFAATDGDRCQHNVNYWRNNYFVGIGAGAASYAPVGRYGCTSKNLSDPNQYMQCVESGKLPAQWDSPLSERTAAEQTLLMGLRLSEGIESASFHERYPGVELSSRVLFELKSRKILSDRADRIQLTQAGQAVCDSVVLRLSAGLNPKIKGYQQVAQTPLG